VVEPGSPLSAALGERTGRRVAFRPEAARISGEGISATVREVTYLGSKTELLVEAEGQALKIWTASPAAIGDVIRFDVPGETRMSWSSSETRRET
jgi:hypothetical protein